MRGKKNKKLSGKRFELKTAGAIKFEPYTLTDQKYLNEEEHTQLITRLSNNKSIKVEKRNVLLITLALATGARASEVLNIRKQDLLPGNRIFIHGLKGSNDRTLPVPKWLFDDLKELPSTSDFIFTISYEQFRRIWFMYRPVKKKLHALRHTFAIRLYQKERDILLVQKALGHRSLDCSLIYLKFVDTKEALEKVIDPSLNFG